MGSSGTLRHIPVIIRHLFTTSPLPGPPQPALPSSVPWGFPSPLNPGIQHPCPGHFSFFRNILPKSGKIELFVPQSYFLLIPAFAIITFPEGKCWREGQWGSDQRVLAGSLKRRKSFCILHYLRVFIFRCKGEKTHVLSNDARFYLLYGF